MNSPCRLLKVIQLLSILTLVLPATPRAARAQSLPLTNWGLSATHSAGARKLVPAGHRVIVAIIDTGADIHHPDLADNIWVNPGESGTDSLGRERSNNGIDDDRNGFIDDVHGWNFAAGTSDVSDHHGHGTHIAGIIGATGRHIPSIVGVAPHVQLMILKYYEPKHAGGNPLRNTVRAIDYAVKMGAQVINYSAGGGLSNEDEKAAIQRAGEHGVLFVAAAGNEGCNSDQHRYFPADYGLANILSVTAIDTNKHVLSTSNYGTETVQLAAPGENILSTLPEKHYGFMTGTSQATAFASGAAAVILSREADKELQPAALIRILVQTGSAEASLIGKTKFVTALDTYRALVLHDEESGISGHRIQNLADIDPEVFMVDNESSDLAPAGLSWPFVETKSAF